jgi:hypothetical protein
LGSLLELREVWASKSIFRCRATPVIIDIKEARKRAQLIIKD